MKYLITGGAGFIGSHIAEKLVNLGHEVVIFDNFSTGKRENLAPIEDKIEVVEGDICDLEVLKQACQGVDCISHHAAQISVPVSLEKPQETLDINAKGTLNVLIAAQENNVKKVTYSSSSAVYGDTENLPITEEEPLSPLSPYAVGKALGEYYCEVFSYLYGLDITMFRYFNVFGQRQDPSSQYSGVIAKFIKATKAGEELTIYGDGEQTRDFMPVDSIVQANISAFEAESPGLKILNIGAGQTITINQLANTIKEIHNADSKINHEQARDGDIVHSCADIEKAKKHLNWDSSYSLKQELLKI